MNKIHNILDVKKQIILISIFLVSCFQYVQAQEDRNEQFPIRGFCIAAPTPDGVDLFVKFIEQEFVPANFNLLILRVGYNYAYESHPELRVENPLTKSDVKKIVAVCKKHHITLVPKFNLLGHQSANYYEGGYARNLLKVYPEFDETPHLDSVECCRSYCPSHPGVHPIVFALIDELLDVFEANHFHAGMDEVLEIGNDKCPRCSGHDKAELFAGEVKRIYNHLTARGARLYIWGDRLIDGKTTGMGKWEASMNTYPAIDMIPKDVFICDWHYDRADLTSVFFAMKGFDVAICTANNAEVASIQINDMLRFRKQSNSTMAQRFQGFIQTVWLPTEDFLKYWYDIQPPADERSKKYLTCMKQVINEFKKCNSKKIY